MMPKMNKKLNRKSKYQKLLCPKNINNNISKTRNLVLKMKLQTIKVILSNPIQNLEPQFLKEYLTLNILSMSDKL
jgi:hypothetical protein